MRLRVRARGGIEVSAEERRAIERRMRLALGRHAAGIAVAQVTVSPGRPFRDSETLCCRVRMRGRAGGSLTVEAHAEDLESATERVAWRLSHRLERPWSTPLALGPAEPRGHPPVRAARGALARVNHHDERRSKGDVS